MSKSGDKAGVKVLWRGFSQGVDSRWDGIGGVVVWEIVVLG